MKWNFWSGNMFNFGKKTEEKLDKQDFKIETHNHEIRQLKKEIERLKSIYKSSKAHIENEEIARLREFIKDLSSSLMLLLVKHYKEHVTQITTESEKKE